VLSEEAYKRTRDWLAQHSMNSTEETMVLKGFQDSVSVRRLTGRDLSESAN
jgi:hypothetical protein